MERVLSKSLWQAGALYCLDDMLLSLVDLLCSGCRFDAIQYPIAIYRYAIHRRQKRVLQ